MSFIQLSKTKPGSFPEGRAASSISLPEGVTAAPVGPASLPFRWDNSNTSDRLATRQHLSENIFKFVLQTYLKPSIYKGLYLKNNFRKPHKRLNP